MKTMSLFYAALFVANAMPTISNAQQSFCEVAAKNIPFTTSTSASVEVVTRQIWDSSRNQNFQSEQEFSEWSNNSDSGASFKLFSFSHGSSSSRQTGSFAERYSDYSRDYAETLSSYRANSVGERYPSREFIGEVLSRCAPGLPIFAVITPGSDLTSFSARLVFNTPGISSQRIRIVNAECREGNGRFADTFETDADSAALECRRLNNALATIGFNSRAAEASAELPTPDTVLKRLETLIGHQAARIATQAEVITGLQDRIGALEAANLTQNQRIDSTENSLRLVGATCDMTSLGSSPEWKKDKSINGREVHVRLMAVVKNGALDDYATGAGGDNLVFFCVAESSGAKVGAVGVCPSNANCPWWP
ncbi:hypothetical protein [Ruegeria sp. ANG-R]|uniref:hypothetical protein n=1 Tax=Ruegeria sp. ANG-R TaxID=1577903 RepID=UPI001269CC5C|nr:hypothetical protein [Ruegeria sp. ANG-R]